MTDRTIDDMLDELEPDRGMWDGTPAHDGPARSIYELKAKLMLASKGSDELDHEILEVLGDVGTWRFTQVEASARTLIPENFGYEIKRLNPRDPVTVILSSIPYRIVFVGQHDDICLAICLAALTVYEAQE